MRGLWRVEFEYCRRHVRLGATADLELAQATAAIAIPLIFGRDARLADGTAFDEDKIDSLAEIARGLPPEVLRRVLDRTAGLGDALSAQLRERIMKDDRSRAR